MTACCEYMLGNAERSSEKGAFYKAWNVNVVWHHTICLLPSTLCPLPLTGLTSKIDWPVGKAVCICLLPSAHSHLPSTSLTGKAVWSAGIAGGAGPGAFSNNGATVAEMYDPSKPVGSRWSTLADSQIWRLYHSTAVLTKNAEVRACLAIAQHGVAHVYCSVYDGCHV